ncbi:MAG: Dna2/Cas4 domain-containing protein, partial [Pseudonocardiales bacterium]|nr:Dna2/Cas4 domain-containing protein [Pseudonocardiales bacterium]
MISAEDVGGVHVKYLYHCPRQLWLFARGLRPERLSSLVQLGEAVHDTTYTRRAPVDLGAARIDFIDGQTWVHEVKSSSRSTEADQAQAIHYCHRLDELGVPVQGGILHYGVSLTKLPGTAIRGIPPGQRTAAAALRCSRQRPTRKTISVVTSSNSRV